MILRRLGGSVGGPVGQCEYDVELDGVWSTNSDGEPYFDGDIINIYWRNPNPEDGALVVTSRMSGHTETLTLTANTPDYVTVPVPRQFQMRTGHLSGQLQYPA